MSTDVVVESEINAPIEKVWDLLANVEGYRDWSRVFSFVKAKAEPGGWAILKARLAGPVAMFVPVRFDTFDEQREIRWHGGVGPVAYGSHYLKLQAIDENTTLLTHGEDFTGVAIKAGWGLIGKQLPGAYKAFNREVQRKLG